MPTANTRKFNTFGLLLTSLALAILLGLAFASRHTLDSDVAKPSNPGSLSATKLIEHEGFGFELLFMNNVETEGLSSSWTSEHMKPYIAAASRWLELIKGIQSADYHKVAIKIYVKPLKGANGIGGPDDLIEYDGQPFPENGEIVIGSHTYQAGFDQKEFHANITHEIGHVLGIGTLTEDLVHYDKSYQGQVFRLPNSQAVRLYNAMYKNTFDFVPFSDDRGHLYDNLDGGDKTRILENGETIPAMTQELMANGFLIGKMSLAILDDIGYEVNYAEADTYLVQTK